jgi:hypothetical protein
MKVSSHPPDFAVTCYSKKKLQIGLCKGIILSFPKSVFVVESLIEYYLGLNNS